jgi:ATP-dependent Clp protease ATP-binding subunit ClpC
VEKCPHCGAQHAGACPLVKAVDYYPDGSVKRVEYRDAPAAGCFTAVADFACREPAPLPPPGKVTFERFTDRARKVMQLAKQEALRLGHDAIGPGHVLVGLAKERSGVAASLWEKAGVLPDVVLRDARRRLESLQLSAGDVGSPPRRTPECDDVLRAAIESARSRGDNYVGSEHLMFGLLRAGGCFAELLAELVAAPGERTADPRPDGAAPPCACPTADLMARGCTCGAAKPGPPP